MKNIFYLPVLALIIFCSCKGNSFENRRYTHFNNKQNKSSSYRVAAHTNEKQQVLAQKVTVSEKTKEVVQKSLAEESPTINHVVASGELSALSTPYKFRELPQHSENSQSFSSEGFDRNNLIVDKTSNAQSSHAYQAKALIGELLSLVLYIILLCILVSAFILLIVIL